MAGNLFGDVILPPKGGWIIVKRRLPSNLPQVPIFSIFYAKPGNVHLEGNFTQWPPGASWAGHVNSEAPAIYRHRYTRTKLFGAEAEIGKSADDDGIGLEMQIEIQAPDGTVTLNPYEWTPCGDVRPFIEEVGNGVTLHEYGETAAPDKSTAWKLFYMQQRGIPKAEAVRLLMGDVTKPGVFWLELAPEITRYFDREAA